MSELLTAKELAAALKKSYWFVMMMKRQGFQMPGGTATIQEAKLFLSQRPFNSRGGIRFQRRSIQAMEPPLEG